MNPAEATADYSELTLISLAIMATKLDPQLVERVKPDDLQDVRHQLIWRAILDEVRDGGKDCPSLVVVDRLKKQGAIKTAGGVKYVDSFNDFYSKRSLGSLPNAVGSVLEAASARRLASIARGVVETAEGHTHSAALATLRDALANVGGGGVSEAVPALHALTSGLTDVFRSGLRTGTALDRRIDLAPGRMYIIGGRPGHGKTTLTLQLVLHMLATNPEATALFCSCEMTAAEVALKALCCIEQHDYITPLRQLAGAGSEAVALAAATNSAILSRLFVKPSRSIDEVCSDAYSLHRSQKLGLVVVDYLSAFDAPAGAKYDTRSREVGAVSRECKALAQRLDCVVIAASQLNRASKASAAPMLNHLRDTGEAEQDADGVMLLHRPDHDEPDAIAKLLIAKNRWGELGSIDLVPDLAHHRFEFSA